MMSITNSPLLPIDFVMASQLGKISGFVKLPIKPYLSLGITLFALHAIIYTSAFLYLRRKKKFSIKRYLRNLVLASVLFSAMFHLVCYDKYFKYTILPKIDCKISGFDSANNYFSDVYKRQLFDFNITEDDAPLGIAVNNTAVGNKAVVNKRIFAVIGRRLVAHLCINRRTRIEYIFAHVAVKKLEIVFKIRRNAGIAQNNAFEFVNVYADVYKRQRQT